MAMARMIAGGAVGVAMAFGALARADETCGVTVVSEGLAPTWTGAIAELRAQIGRLAGSECQPMVLSVEPSDGWARVVATTPDGRRAARTVQRPEALLATALGLLMTIPAAETDVPSTPPPPAPPAAIPAPKAVETAPTPSPPRLPAQVYPQRIGVWAGLSAGLRLTAPTAVTVLDVEARGDVLFERWMLLATIRSAVISCVGQQGLDCDVYTDVSTGIGVGRRLRAGPAEVDVAFEPSLVVMHMEYDAYAGAEAQAWTGTLVTLRADLSARLALPIGNGWALTVTLDGGLAPTILANPTTLQPPAGAAPTTAQPPPFPAWTGGLRVGASGALL
jgi:hypothetical protein